MSLDVYLNLPGAVVERGSGIFIRENGATVEISREEWDRRFPGREPVTMSEDVGSGSTVYSRNITHNLGKMAAEAGLYVPLWRPETAGFRTARDLIEPLRRGLTLLKAEPEHYRRFAPANGWGTYESLVEFVEGYLAACEKYPAADLTVSR
jgi:hypothetical protein